MNTTAFALSLLLVCSCALRLPSAAAAPARTVSFAGSLRRQGVWLDLTIDRSKITGSYFYTQPTPFFLDRLDCAGSVAADGSLRLSAVSYDDNGNPHLSPLFQGRLVGYLNGVPSPARLAGEWRQGKSQTPLTLREQAGDLPTSIHLTSRHFHQESAPLNDTLDITAPVLLETGHAAARFNAIVGSLVQKEVSDFKAECRKALRSDPRYAARPRPSDLPKFGNVITYELLAANPQVISLRISEEPYLGGAHPTHDDIPVNFDLASGQMLTLSSLFQPGAPYLKTISQDCVVVLRGAHRDLDSQGFWASFLKEGSAPTAQNYRVWNLAPYGLVIAFEEYQVAAYVFGRSEVVIPYPALRPLLKPQVAPWLR